LLFPKSVDEVNWTYRSGAAALWVFGFVTIVSSILVRFSKAPSNKRSS
jgi:hypothetical protein